MALALGLVDVPRIWEIGLPLLGAVVAALVLGVLHLPAPRGDADVHDRQLDWILALPMFVLTGWLLSTLGGQPVVRSLALALVTFAVSCLLLGTRRTSRLRWSLAALAVAGLPDGWFVAAGAVVVALGLWRWWVRPHADPGTPASASWHRRGVPSLALGLVVALLAVAAIWLVAGGLA